MSAPYRASALSAGSAASSAFPTIQDALGCAVNGDSVSPAPTGPTPYPGHNLISNVGTGTGTGACSGLTNRVNGDQVGVPAGLLPLANNGGPTNTAALAPTSPAIGAGNPTTCAQAPISDKDQRGHSRNATTRGGCDIGAYDTGGAP